MWRKRGGPVRQLQAALWLNPARPSQRRGLHAATEERSGERRHSPLMHLQDTAATKFRTRLDRAHRAIAQNAINRGRLYPLARRKARMARCGPLVKTPVLIAHPSAFLLSVVVVEG